MALATKDRKTLAYYEICPFSINYETVKHFIVQAPGPWPYPVEITKLDC
jgi:hypothetical protein